MANSSNLPRITAHTISTIVTITILFNLSICTIGSLGWSEVEFAFAQPSYESNSVITTTAAKGQTLYTIGVYLINIGKVDLQNGAYDLDFYVWISSNDSTTDFTKSQPKIDFMNAMNIKIDTSKVEHKYWEARVKGTFLKNMDFRNYPFDKHGLTIEVEGFDMLENMTFVADDKASGFDSLINMPGWNLGGAHAEVIEHHYPDGTYARYVFTFTIERAVLSSVLKIILPIIIITTIAMLAFWMSPTNFAPRIGLAASTLLAAVAAHLNAANQLPPIGYLTLFDKLMIVVYSLFLNNLLSMVLQMRLVDRKKEEQAIRVNARMRTLMPIIISTILAALIPFDIHLI